MSDEDLSGIIDDAQIEDQAEAVETEVEAPEETVVEAEAEPTPEPEAEKPVTVPLSAVIEERAKRQRLEEQLAELQKPKAQEPVQFPDVLDDQAGFTQTIQQQIQQMAQNVELNVSERLTRQQYGQEAVDAAFRAAQESGAIAQFQGKQDAWGELVRWHQQQEAAREIGDPTTYKERVRAEILKEVQAEMAAKQISAAPSLAGETSIGGRKSAPAPTLTPLDDLLG